MSFFATITCWFALWTELRILNLTEDELAKIANDIDMDVDVNIETVDAWITLSQNGLGTICFYYFAKADRHEDDLSEDEYDVYHASDARERKHADYNRRYNERLAPKTRRQMRERIKAARARAQAAHVKLTIKELLEDSKARQVAKAKRDEDIHSKGMRWHTGGNGRFITKAYWTEVYGR